MVYVPCVISLTTFALCEFYYYNSVVLVLVLWMHCYESVIVVRRLGHSTYGALVSMPVIQLCYSVMYFCVGWYEDSRVIIIQEWHNCFMGGWFVVSVLVVLTINILAEFHVNIWWFRKRYLNQSQCVYLTLSDRFRMKHFLTFYVGRIFDLLKTFFINVY